MPIGRAAVPDPKEGIEELVGVEQRPESLILKYLCLILLITSGSQADSDFWQRHTLAAEIDAVQASTCRTPFELAPGQHPGKSLPLLMKASIQQDSESAEAFVRRMFQDHGKARLAMQAS